MHTYCVRALRLNKTVDGVATHCEPNEDERSGTKRTGQIKILNATATVIDVCSPCVFPPRVRVARETTLRGALLHGAMELRR